MSKQSAGFWIQHLQLNRHIEGGWYAELYRSPLSFSAEQLPTGFTGTRQASTHIYFLLEKDQFSAFHRIRQDELWHFYEGDPITVYEIDAGGILTSHVLGRDAEAEQSFFCCIKGGNWFAASVNSGGDYSLVGCTVAPGFDFADFEMADRHELIRLFPQHASLITSLSQEK